MAQKSKAITGRRLRESLRDYFHILIFIIFTALVIGSEIRVTDPEPNALVSVDNGWTDDSGEILNLDSLPPGDITLTRILNSDDSNEDCLCMISMDTCFDVSADGREIYSYYPEVPKLLGKSYGMYVHTVQIPGGTSEIKLDIHPVFGDLASGTLVDARLGSGTDYISQIFRRRMAPFVYSILTVIVGVLFLGVGISRSIVSRLSAIDFISYGAFCLMLGFSGLNDTYYLQIAFNHPSSVRVITYFCLILMPYPALRFFASAAGGKYRAETLVFWLCAANFLTQIILTWTGVSDYFNLVYISHIILLLASAIAIWIVVDAVRKKTIRPRLVKRLAFGLSACVLGAGFDVLRFNMQWNNEFSNFSRIGVIIFMVTISHYLFTERVYALKIKHKENTLFIKEITEAFAKVIDMKDTYTNGHSIRVARYTSMIADELGYDDDTIQKYYRIALLHDIGKIGVPSEVLNKPGKLTDEEFEIVKSHSEKGYDVLKDISIMPELATGAGSHHERADGKGYPRALKGNEIPRVAQIIAVADCFDAMYSNRPYRNRMNFEKAVSIIKEVSGTQLTSDVVDAFLRLVERGEFKAVDDNGGGTTENIDNIRKV